MKVFRWRLLNQMVCGGPPNELKVGYDGAMVSVVKEMKNKYWWISNSFILYINFKIYMYGLWLYTLFENVEVYYTQLVRH